MKKYAGPAKPVPTHRVNVREVAFIVGYHLLAFAGLAVLLMDLLVWRPG